MPTPPTVADIKAYLGTTSLSDEVIASALAAEIAAQNQVCRFPVDPVAPADPLPYPADLAEALKRRVARNLAMRKHPEAVVLGDAELGTTSATLTSRDPEVRRLEGPHRKLVFG